MFAKPLHCGFHQCGTDSAVAMHLIDDNIVDKAGWRPKLFPVMRLHLRIDISDDGVVAFGYVDHDIGFFHLAAEKPGVAFFGPGSGLDETLGIECEVRAHERCAKSSDSGEVLFPKVPDRQITHEGALLRSTGRIYSVAWRVHDLRRR